MSYARYEYINEPRAVARVSVGGMSTPVWFQNRWETDSHEYACFIVRNGCGHCCAAMALTLHGHSIDPLSEYILCRELWGAPREVRNPDGTKSGQANFQSVSGITKIIRHHGVRAECFGVPDSASVGEHIDRALREGKQVIFCTRASADNPDNPFSTGYHWVMAVGYTESGSILVANSSEKYTDTGVQEVDLATVLRAMCHGSEPTDMTWGEWHEDFKHGTGYIVVG